MLRVDITRVPAAEHSLFASQAARISRVFIENAGPAGGQDAANYRVWGATPDKGAPDAWVFAHERGDGAEALVEKAMHALLERGCAGECRL